MMTIAIPCAGGNVVPQLGAAETYMIFKLDHGRIVSGEPICCKEPARLAEEYNVDVLICGELEDALRDACERAGLMLFPGASGSAEAAAKAFADGTLEFNPHTGL